MKLFTLIGFIVLFFAWENCRGENLKNDHWIENMPENDPVLAAATIVFDVGGPSCRRGYYNLTEEWGDAINHCAGITYSRSSRLRLDNHPRVDFKGPTPILCQKSCVAREVGAWDDETNQFHEERTYTLFAKGFHNPGGIESAHKLTQELIECSRKYPTEIPKFYHNCKDTKELFRCVYRVLHNCDHHSTEREYLGHKRSHDGEDDDATNTTRR